MGRRDEPNQESRFGEAIGLVFSSHSAACSPHDTLSRLKSAMESYSSAELGLADFPDVQISIKVPERTTSGDSWTGFYRSAGGGGISEMSPTKTDLHLAGREFDMDAATGYKRSPGTAGAHPVIKGEGEHSASFLRHAHQCDMGRAASCPQTSRFY